MKKSENNQFFGIRVSFKNCQEQWLNILPCENNEVIYPFVSTENMKA